MGAVFNYNYIVRIRITGCVYDKAATHTACLLSPPQCHQHGNEWLNEVACSKDEDVICVCIHVVVFDTLLWTAPPFFTT